MKLWWPVTPRPGNVGDLIGPWLYLKSTGQEATRATSANAEGSVLTCGSVAGLAGATSTVWGSGAMRDTDRLNPGARYLAARGPLTRYLIHKAGGTCPALYGDPGLLAPRFLHRPKARGKGVGIVPHYVDGERARAVYAPEQVISPIQTVEAFVAALCRFEVIGSSSLHGIILAHAYSIPAVWIRMSDMVLGDGFKFYDYFEAVGAPAVCLNTMADGRAASDAEVREAASLPARLPDLDALWGARPWA